ncbi:MAG: cytochrome C oxidase subunit IV family protein [Oligoflexales bacterium]|nr:cytochrome C oxidase subunit IV family protein [Oligoflexales bacterium]
MKDHENFDQHEHFIMPVSVYKKIWLLLLVLTVVTVLVSRVHLGPFNFFVAMLIATFKAGAVVFYFMGLKHDSTENRVIFFSSFIFVAIFIVLTYSDILFRGDVYVH